MCIAYFAEPQRFNDDCKIILSGSFNPLHDGHLKLLEVATRYFDVLQQLLVFMDFFLQSILLFSQ